MTMNQRQREQRERDHANAQAAEDIEEAKDGADREFHNKLDEEINRRLKEREKQVVLELWGKFSEEFQRLMMKARSRVESEVWAEAKPGKEAWIKAEGKRLFREGLSGES